MKIKIQPFPKHTLPNGKTIELPFMAFGDMVLLQKGKLESFNEANFAIELKRQKAALKAEYALA